MDAGMVTALAALIAGPVTAAAAMYGTRGANRAAREGHAVTGLSTLTDQLQEERQELRTELATVRAELAAARTELTAERAENARLQQLVLSLGGQP